MLLEGSSVVQLSLGSSDSPQAVQWVHDCNYCASVTPKWRQSIYGIEIVPSIFFTGLL